MKFIFSKKYYADIGLHVFPIEKYLMLHEKLLREGIMTEKNVLEPQPASRDDLLLVHTEKYVEDLLGLKRTPSIMRSELPITQEIVDSYLLATGGTILATRKAMDEGVALNVSGGFHHAFSDHAEGFCYANDIAIAIRRLQKDKTIQKAAVIDCDVHQGNGTAYIFQNDQNVFTFSIHQERNYPVKQQSDQDIGLDDFTDDETYMAHIERVTPKILDEFEPDIVIYLAGADPFMEDRLGGLSLSIDGLRRRDEFIIKKCVERNVPVAILLAGGYAFNTEDTVEIHSEALHT